MTTYHEGMCAQHRARTGLTLLELLLVVFILSTLAFSAVSLTDNLDSQFRYEDTQTRLQQLRAGVVGETGATYSGEHRLTGFVADIGRLPSDINSLVLVGSAATFGRVAPVYDADPDAQGLNDGTNETPLPGLSESLFKGYRGPYLPLRASLTGTPMFRDGWGNVSANPAADAANHGWVVVPATPSNPFTVTSLGADSANGDAGQSVYDPDLSEQITADGWTVDIDGWQVLARTTTGSQPNLRASLLVYFDGKWRRFTSSPGVTVDDADPPEAMTFDSTVTNWPNDGTDPITRIPIGQHLLVLVEDTNVTIHDGELLFDGDPASGIQPVGARVSFHARTERPQLTLVIP